MNSRSMISVIFVMTAMPTLAACGANQGGDEVTSQVGETLNDNGNQLNSQAFTVQSPDFEDGDALPYPNTCEGQPFAAGVSPELNWTKGPKGAKSFAIVLVDTTILDAGQPNFAYHWAIWNIPASRRTLPAGIQGLNPEDATALYPLPESLDEARQSQARGVERFFAPCPAWQVALAQQCGAEVPPRNTDSYSFTVYALPEREIKVDAYDPAVNPNYVDELNALFDSMALGKAELHATSDAVPSAVPFPCP